LKGGNWDPFDIIVDRLSYITKYFSQDRKYPGQNCKKTCRITNLPLHHLVFRRSNGTRRLM